MGSKFNHTIVKSIKNDEAEKKQQQQLKNKYKIPEEDTRIIVEKSNTFKFIVRLSGNIIRLMVNVCIFFFAVTGVAAVIFPASREILMGEVMNVYEQLLQFF